MLDHNGSPASMDHVQGLSVKFLELDTRRTAGIEFSHNKRNSPAPAAEREQAWREIERQFSRLEGPNRVEIPGEFLVGVGTK